jgi:hypothetical protein
VIHRRVIVVTLIDCELEQMFGTSRDRGIVIADSASRFHSGALFRVNVTYDSFAARARMITCGYTLRWIGFSEDDGKQIAEGANIRR